MLNALSIDVEDYWSIFFRDWLNIPEAEPTDAVVKNTAWFLEILSGHNIKATFFIIGEVAEKFPSLIREINKQGHEIASHGQAHRQIFKSNQQEFRQEVERCKKYLEDLTGQEVLGFRAPAFSIIPQTKWALEILAKEGFKYDSSVFPLAARRYGWPGFSKEICKIDLPSGRSIVEVPMSTVTVLSKSLPSAGGGYIRHFPYIVTKLAIKHISKTRPAIVYMHPYEIDTRQIKFGTTHVSGRQKRRALKFHRLQLINRSTMKNKITKLLRDFEFTTLSEVVEQSFVVT